MGFSVISDYPLAIGVPLKMENQLLDLPQWKALQDSERLAATHDLVKRLPKGFVFRSLEIFRLGSQSNTVAFFDWSPGEGLPGKFALIPGGEVTLGYDRDQPFVPTSAQIESWQGTQEEYGTASLDDFLSETLSPRRVVNLRPFLMETTLLDSELLPETISESRPLGFRLPTSDEWEWACGAGARTLWRWGDDCPTDGYPSQHSSESKWNLQRQPNAFGLSIADDDYNQEICEENFIRGGDGGSFTCGGVGYLAAWLTLASAYVVGDQEMVEAQAEFNQGRRVFPL